MYYRVIFATLILTILSATSLSAKEPQSFAGSWSGAISIMGMELPILVDFEQAQELRAFMSIPAQGLNSQELKIIRHEGDEIVFVLNVPGANATFSGTRTGGKMSGSFEQAGALGSFELVYQGVYVPKIEKPFILPPGVSEEEMILKTEAGAIFGTMMLPERKEGFTVALIIAGSGPTDRDGNSPLLPGKNNSLLMLAAGLAEKGIASLRYDKRGVGKSMEAMGEEKDLRVSHYSDDAAAWIKLLRKDPRVKHIIVIGHSEGSMLGMLAAQSAKIDGFVSLAGAGRKFDDVLREQLLKEGSEEYFTEIEETLSALSAGKQVDKVSPELAAIFRPSVQPYLISMFATDPQKLISGLSVPVLIIQGDTDIQVSVEDAQLLAKANPKARYLLIKGMNHILKPAPLDPGENMKTYSDPDIPLAEGLISAIAEFCRELR